MSLPGRPYLRFVVAVALVCSLSAVSGDAAAAPPDIGEGIELTLKLRQDDGDFEDPDGDEDIEFMNLANCVCGDDERSRFAIEFQLKNPPGSLPDEPVEVQVGTRCADTDPDQRQCLTLPGFGDVEELRGADLREIPVQDLVSTDRRCPALDAERSVYAIIDVQADGFDEADDYQTSLPIELDTTPPPPVLTPEAIPSENSILVKWDLPTTEDIRYFQVLCARADNDTDTSEFGRVTARYLTARMACDDQDNDVCILNAEGSGAGLDAGTGADAGAEADAGAGDGGTQCVTGLPTGLQTLDPDFLCGEQTSSTARSADATGLENFVNYHVVLLVVDESRNVTAHYLGQHAPEPVTDFWEDYKNSGGQAKGGCSAAQAGLSGGVGLALTLAFGFGLRSALQRLRRRRGGGGSGPGALTGGAALILVLASTPSLANAQPWWEDSSTYHDPIQGEDPEQPIAAVPHWGLEFKLGPYVPDVDSEFDEDPGPFRRMFGGGPFYMGLVTLDRYLLYPMGQLGVSLTSGFWTWSVHALRRDGTRSPGDTTRFSLVPTSLGVVYRFTEIDDRFRIPIVPYGRAGLSYYYWWNTRPDGGVAIVEGDKAHGGSLGWQATVGLAVRLERIDRSAEVSLRNELGIEHMGLVFEVTYAKVDGFGSDEKLAVGDATWFGGINVEF